MRSHRGSSSPRSSKLLVRRRGLRPTTAIPCLLLAVSLLALCFPIWSSVRLHHHSELADRHSSTSPFRFSSSFKPPSASSSAPSGSGVITMSTVAFAGDEIAPFFGFIGAAAALVFSCTSPVFTWLWLYRCFLRWLCRDLEPLGDV